MKRTNGSSQLSNIKHPFDVRFSNTCKKDPFSVSRKKNRNITTAFSPCFYLRLFSYLLLTNKKPTLWSAIKFMKQFSTISTMTKYTRFLFIFQTRRNGTLWWQRGIYTLESLYNNNYYYYTIAIDSYKLQSKLDAIYKRSYLA